MMAIRTTSCYEMTFRHYPMPFVASYISTKTARFSHLFIERCGISGPKIGALGHPAEARHRAPHENGQKPTG